MHGDVLLPAPREARLLERAYARLAGVYDLLFGAILQPGRHAVVDRLPLAAGTRVLEVGIGTALAIDRYPRNCTVIGIDRCKEMLDAARARVRETRSRHVHLLQMDAAHLAFPEATFDVVYAGYVMSAVADPHRVIREMARVCRPGGTVVLLNHFASKHAVIAAVERAISKYTMHLGFRADLELAPLVLRSGLVLESVARVNLTRHWSLVTCRKPEA
jgi:phosphatidylethanolamine/phosphatidyl-N-methylethanolamine N-methyltransferase